ncbi:single-stranded DNA-binding protein [Geobacillus stearothermophilus]|uniref:single-stranded DNA-binding protein n=1 Tax=Geobacillus stearothermophilus TaxID=1422 RepID=UPI002402887F|nr:single-stranded DNA-binding protein [Geobacillus stearothermophilus]MDF9296068.1 single-stranded DNA-binding protein [Geobacillus stearothermophilus]
MNRVVLVGRLTKDVELRYTPNGTAVASFTLAVNRPFTNQQGEREADFISVIAWRKTAENVANYTTRGSLVAVDGRLQTRSYEKDGRRVYVTEVVADNVQFLSRPEGAQSGDKQQGKGNSAAQKKDASTGAREAFSKPPEMDDPFGGEPVEFNDDDLPF